jgi:hypothetical protein
MPKENELAAPSGTTQASEPADWAWAAPRSLKVKAAFRRLVPLQAKGELLALAKSIQEEGCREPLLVWKGRRIVLDGHTRRALCIKYGKPVKIREIELADAKAASALILQLQWQRRNLTREALSYFRGAEYNATKQKRGGDRSSAKAKGQSDPLLATAERLAACYGVSAKTIKRDGVFAQMLDQLVEESSDADLRRKLLGADVALTPRRARLLLTKPAAKRKLALQYLLEPGKWAPGTKPRTGSAAKPKDVAQAIMARLTAKGEGYARAVLRHLARLLGFEVRKPPAAKRPGLLGENEPISSARC